MPNTRLMRGRLITGLILAMVGICLGVAGMVFINVILAVVASICAITGSFLVAGVAWLALMSRSNATDPSQPHDWQPPQLEDGHQDSVIDPVTEFPNEKYFEPSVESRVAAARRHLWPVSIVLLEVGFDEEAQDAVSRNKALTSLAEIMRKTLREADIACRLDNDVFALILEDTSEEGGVWTAERIQIALSQCNDGIESLVAGVAAYPTHGLHAEDVTVRARAALARASATPPGHGLGQVEVAHIDMS